MLKTKIELEIIKRIVAIRGKKITQRDIAEYLNVSPGYIGQVESKNSPSMYSINQLNDLAKIFECSLHAFFPENPV